MEPILNLSPQQFRAALAELQLDPQREAALIEQYNAVNAPQQGGRNRGMLRNLLDNIIGFDDEVVTPGERLGAGVQQFAGGFLSDPIGTGADIVRGGYETIERAMAPGATPMDVMGAAGMAMGAGGLLSRPVGSVGSNSIRVFHGGPERITSPRATVDPEGLLEGFSVARTPNVAQRYADMRGGGSVSEFEIDTSQLKAINEMEFYDFIADLETRLGVDEGELTDAQIRNALIDEGFNAISYPDEDFGIRILDTNILKPVSQPADLSANRSTTAGLLASAASDTPAQRVARLLREGRADEVTDDLMAQADPQEMYRLYVAGETGMDLPMDEASRMARAREMGFDTPAYHSTDTNISAVDNDRLIGGQFWSTDDVDAINRGEVGAAGRGVVLPLQIRQQNPAGWRQYDQLGVDELMGRGYDGLRLPESDGTNTFVTFDPEQVRSRFARFDPRLSQLANLNAANVDPLTGAAAVTASQQDDPLANLRAYISAAGGILPR